MKILPSFQSSNFIKILIPGLVAPFMLTIQRMIKNIFFHTQRLDSNILNHPENESKSLLESIPGITESLEKTILEGNDNYLSFLMIMLLINVFLHGSDILRALFTKREKRNNTNVVSHWRNIAERIKQILVSLLIGSLLFYCYHFIWICIGSKISEQTTLNNIQNPLLPSRILEEGPSPSFQLQEYRKPSLSIGKILGQVDILTVALQVSKDGKTAFAITSFPTMLKIIDVSDPESPAILSSLSLFMEDSSSFILKGILVSPDEKKLYASSFGHLMIIDITNLKSPLVLASIQDKERDGDEHFDGLQKPNLLLSRDNKFLFVSEYGLRIFDISVSTAPILIRSLRSRIISDSIVPSSIALSADKKTLYYSDGGLWVYNVEDARDIRVMSSFNTTYPISSMMISDDSKTAFVLGLDQESKILLQNLDISDTSSIREGQVIQFNRTSDSLPGFLERTPGNLFLLILFADEDRGLWHDLLIFDTQEQRFRQHEKLFIKTDALSIVFSEDYRRVFVGNFGNLEIVDLCLDYPNKHAFTTSSNAIQTYDVSYNFFSTSGSGIVFSVTNDEFRIDQIGFEKTLRSLSSMKAQGKIINKEVTLNDHKKAFLMEEKGKVEIIDISNLQNITAFGEYQLKTSFGPPKIRSLASSPDGKTFYLTYSASVSNYLEIVDISDPTKPTQMNSMKIGGIAIFATTLLSNDGRTLFVISHALFIYDVSRPSDPELLSRFSFVDEDSISVARPSIFGTLSTDGKALFIRDESSESETSIYVIDVSNVTSPRTQSEFRFSKPALEDLYAEKTILVSGDSKRIYIARPSSLMVVDVSKLNDPKYLGSISFGSDHLKDFSLSDDGRKAFVLTKDGKFMTVSIEPKYSTLIMQDNLMLGERYNIDVQAIKMNEYLDYDQMEVDYRFTKFSLVEPKSMQNAHFGEVTLKMPPSWMSFDLKSQTLNVEAHRKSDIKAYRVYFGFSTQIPKDAFNDLKIANETLKFQDIFSLLISLAYVDNQLELTENFGLYKDFILPSLYDLIQPQIYDILKRYSFGTYNELKIIQSLVVSETDESKLKISTTSGVNLKVEISLAGEGAQFLHRYDGSLRPTILNNKSQLVMEGSLKDINGALKEIVINLHQNLTSCDGEIVIDDKLNPIRTESIKNISRHFHQNKPPMWNKNFILTVQDQVDKELVYTGQYFQIKLNQKTFLDLYTDVENLSYHLVFMKDNNETTVLPDWLSFSDLTLMGTAPEEMFKREFEFKLVVKNEFQEYKDSLKINVKISSSFVLKLLMKYGPYILSILAIIIKANKIFNILFKGIYKHPKDFHVRTGEEITSDVLYPISFIQEELIEAKKILKLLEKKSGSRNKLLDYFTMSGERRLDKTKILETIKDSLNELTRQEKENFEVYLRGIGEEILHPRRIINQIIIKTLTNNLLKSNEEKETRKCFEKIKNQWPVFVKWDSMNSCFKINDEKFNHQESILTNDNDDDDKENSLLYKTGINIDLLKDAILAYAFDCHNINALAVRVEFHVKEKIKTNFVKRFLKLNLKECPFKEKGKIGYGIGYIKKYNTVSFNGVIDSDIIDKTIIMQITNSRQRILKELWIYGHGKRNKQQDRSEVDGSVEEGKDYDML